jgi:protocadherin delta 1
MSCQIHFRLALSFAVTVLVVTDLFSTVAAQGEIIELTYELVEEQPLGTYVGNIVRDANLTSLYGADVVEAGRIRFRFIRPPSPVELVVDSITGDVRTGRDRIDRESICTPRSVLCTIRVDIAIHPIEYFRLVRLTVKIADINDGSPRFPEGAVLTYDILESAAVGTAIKLPAAVDRDSPSYSVVGYRLVTPSDDANVRRKFKLIEDRSRDGVLHVRLVVAEPLDRESVDRYQLTVVATDGGTPPKTGSVDVVINVIDANDNIPLFDREEYDAIIAENAPR